MPGTRVGSQHDAALFPLSDYSLAVHLADATLRAIFLGNNPPVHERCVLYQYWDDGALGWPADAVILYEGTLGHIAGGSAQSFQDRDVTIRLHIIDRFKTLIDKDVGNKADKETFANVLEDHEGQVIPIVYGRAKKVRAICVKGPKRGALLRRICKDTTTLYIDGGENFTQGTPMTIRIGMEHIEGSFSGNTFTVTGRGASVATLTAASPANYNAGLGASYKLVQHTDAAGVDDQYTGYWLGVAVGVWAPGDIATYGYVNANMGNALQSSVSGSNGYNSRQWVPIVRYDAANKVLELGWPYYREGRRTISPTGAGPMSLGHQALVASGTSMTVGTLPAPHSQGEEVFEVHADYKYIVNNAPSHAIQGVYFHGIKAEWISPSELAERFINSGGGIISVGTVTLGQNPAPMSLGAGVNMAPSTSAFGGAIGAQDKDMNPEMNPIESSFYSVDLDDNTWVADLGHNVTTLTFKILPQWIPGWTPDGFDIYVDLEGIENDGGNMIENPADVIDDVLQNRVGIAAADINTASFTAAATATNWLHFAGPIERIISGRELATWLAVQCRCRIQFEAGEIYLNYLINGSGAAVSPVIQKANIIMDTAQLRWEDPGEVINEIEYVTRDKDGKEASAVLKQSTSITDYGRKQTRLDMKLLSSKAEAKQVAHFWLDRWAWPWRRFGCRGYLPFLPFLRDDNVVVDWSDWSIDSVPGRVTDLRHEPDEINVDGIIYQYLGCSASCEGYCETGCESSCENWCQTGCETTGCEAACETACQTLCQLACTTAAENVNGICGANTGAAACIGCVMGCTTEAVDDAPGGEEDNCKTACQTCQGSCVSACMVSCEVACETSYVTNDCDTSCIVGGCESNCEAGGCETCCMTGCEVHTEAVCMNACEAAGCEPACEAGCEASCEPACQTGCELGTQCGCPGTCEAGCEAGCTASCEQGCETVCETGSTTNDCSTSCIISACETQCQVGGCEVSCETAQTSDFSCDKKCEPSGCEAASNKEELTGGALA